MPYKDKTAKAARHLEYMRALRKTKRHQPKTPPRTKEEAWKRMVDALDDADLKQAGVALLRSLQPQSYEAGALTLQGPPDVVAVVLSHFTRPLSKSAQAALVASLRLIQTQARGKSS